MSPLVPTPPGTTTIADYRQPPTSLRRLPLLDATEPAHPPSSLSLSPFFLYPAALPPAATPPPFTINHLPYLLHAQHHARSSWPLSGYWQSPMTPSPALQPNAPTVPSISNYNTTQLVRNRHCSLQFYLEVSNLAKFFALICTGSA